MKSFKKCSKNYIYFTIDTSPIALYRIYHSTNTNIFSIPHTNTFDFIYFILCAREYIYYVHLAFTQLTFVHIIVCMNIPIMIIIEPPFDKKWWMKYYSRPIINTMVGFVLMLTTSRRVILYQCLCKSPEHHLANHKCLWHIKPMTLWCSSIFICVRNGILVYCSRV